MALPLSPTGGSHLAWEADVLVTVKDKELGKDWGALRWTQRSIPDLTQTPKPFKALGSSEEQRRWGYRGSKMCLFTNPTNKNDFLLHHSRSTKMMFYTWKKLGPWTELHTLIHASGSIAFDQWGTKITAGSASPKTDISLTQGHQILVVLQHHVFVHDLLSSIQEIPLLSGEVHMYILEGHECLHHETSLQ